MNLWQPPKPAFQVVISALLFVGFFYLGEHVQYRSDIHSGITLPYPPIPPHTIAFPAGDAPAAPTEPNEYAFIFATYQCAEKKYVETKLFTDHAEITLTDPQNTYASTTFIRNAPQIKGVPPVQTSSGSPDSEPREYLYQSEGDSTYNSYLYDFHMEGENASLTVAAEISSTTPITKYTDCHEVWPYDGNV